jgi:mannosyltransferase OCH1-like enzyme
MLSPALEPEIRVLTRA